MAVNLAATADKRPERVTLKSSFLFKKNTPYVHNENLVSLAGDRPYCTVYEYLIAKLSSYGITGPLLLWLESYLSGRNLVVRYAGLLSSAFKVSSGVPQGSHLGPFLFNMFINDIGESIRVKYLLFADDIKVYSEIVSLRDSHLLQISLDGISNWCTRNEMVLNPSKCVVMTYHRSRSALTFDYNITNTKLNRVYKVKDLGVCMLPSLSLEAHLAQICKRAYKLLGFIMRASRDMSSLSILKTLYLTLVRPVLEYSSVVWSPYQIGHCSQLEKIQRIFIRLVAVRLGYKYHEAPIEELQLKLGLLPLATRRNVLDLMFLFKLLNGSIDCPELLQLIDFRVPSGTRSHQLFSRRNTSTEYALHSPLHRTLRLGTALPSEVDFFNTSMQSFKAKMLRVVGRCDGN